MDESSSSTISTKGLFLIAIITAKEERKVAVVDLPGTYLQTDLKNEKVVVKLDEKLS